MKWVAKDQAFPKYISEASSIHILQNWLPVMFHTIIWLLCNMQYVFVIMLMLEDVTLRQVYRKQGHFREGKGCRKRNLCGPVAAHQAEAGVKGKH